MRLLPKSTAAFMRKFEALSENPSRADRMAPEALTRIASSQSGQRVGEIESGRDARARRTDVEDTILHCNSADPCGDRKNAPTMMAKSSGTGASAFTLGKHGTARTAGALAEATAAAERAYAVLRGPMETNTGVKPASSDPAHETLAPTNVFASLADGQRLRESRNTSTGSPSETTTGIERVVDAGGVSMIE